MRKRMLFFGLLFSTTACGETPLVSPYEIVGDTIPAALTATQGDASRGRTIIENRNLGHCVLCHQVEALEAPFQGDVGPALDDIGTRMTPGQIRLRIVDASVLNPETIMPPYYRVTGLNQVGSDYQGKPALSAQEIEDLVAWLSGQKG